MKRLFLVNAATGCQRESPSFHQLSAQKLKYERCRAMRYIMAELHVQPNSKSALSCCDAGGLPVSQTFSAQVGFGVTWDLHAQRVVGGGREAEAAHRGPTGRLVLQGLHGDTVNLVPAIVWCVHVEEELASCQHSITGIFLLQKHVKLRRDAGKLHSELHERRCERGPLAHGKGEGQAFQITINCGRIPSAKAAQIQAWHLQPVKFASATSPQAVTPPNRGDAISTHWIIVQILADVERIVNEFEVSGHHGRGDTLSGGRGKEGIRALGPRPNASMHGMAIGHGIVERAVDDILRRLLIQITIAGAAEAKAVTNRGKINLGRHDGHRDRLVNLIENDMLLVEGPHLLDAVQEM